MVGRFGSREICDVTFKASQEGQKIGKKNFHKGQPVFVIDTATASSMEQATTTVYAQGGKGYNRLIAWEGEKTVTFNVTDALISPLGLAMLTGAGLADASETALKHIHMTVDVALDADGKASLSLEQLNDDLGITAEVLHICYENKFKPYATVLDNNGAIVDWVDAEKIAISSEAAQVFVGTVAITEEKDAQIAVTGISNQTIKLDFYLAMSEKATQVTIAPDSFGGTFYVEADTLYRNQNGQDMAATLTFPKAKIQSGFTLSMSPTGDPSTFDFVMDAMPGYTYFDSTKKVVCDIMIVGDDAKNDDVDNHKDHTKVEEAAGGDDTPVTPGDDTPAGGDPTPGPATPVPAIDNVVITDNGDGTFDIVFDSENIEDGTVEVEIEDKNGNKATVNATIASNSGLIDDLDPTAEGLVATDFDTTATVVLK